MNINLNEGFLPSGWESCVLPDFSVLVMGQSPASETYNMTQEGLPFYQGKAEFGEYYPTPAKYCSKPKKVAESGAVLMSVRAPVGPTNIADYKCCIGRGLAAIHPTDKIQTKFLLYFFRSIETRISKQGTGSTFTAINKQFLEGMKVALPPLNEQTRIVEKIEELFSELDKGVESLKIAQQQLKVYRQALLKQAFEGKLTEQWRKENPDKVEPAEQLLERIKTERAARHQQQLDDWQQAVKAWEAAGKEGKKPAKPKKLKELPALTEEELAGSPVIANGWMWVRFNELVLSVRGGTTAVPKNEKTKYPILRSSSVRQGSIDYSDVRYLEKEQIKSTNDYVKANDLLFTRLNGTIDFVGNCVRIGNSFPDKLIYPDRLYCANLAITDLAKYAEAVFLAPFIRKNIEDRAKSTAGHKRISIPDILELAIPVPNSLDECNQIVELLGSALSNISNLEGDIATNLQKSNALRQSILKKAFSGQLVSQNPDDEPASALLARIKAEREAAEQATKAAKKAARKTAKAST